MLFTSFYIQYKYSTTMVLSHAVVSDSLQPSRPQPARLLCPWDSSGKNTGMGCHFLLQGILLTQGSNLHLLHCRQILPQGSPSIFLLLLKLEMLTVLTYFKLPRQGNFNSSLSPSSFTSSIQLAHFILLSVDTSVPTTYHCYNPHRHLLPLVWVTGSSS